MTDDNTVVLVIAGIIAYQIIKNDVKGIFGGSPLSQEQSTNMIKTAGGTVTNGVVTGGTYWKIPGGVAAIDDSWNPNLAQKILIGADAFIPGDWLTRKVLGV